MQVRGQAFNELQYMALSLIESTILKLDWDGFLPGIRMFTHDDEDAKTVLQLIKQAVVVVGFDDEEEVEGE
jgi:hypothetical protein